MKTTTQKRFLSQLCTWLIYLVMTISLSLNIVACSNESSSNNPSSTESRTECSDGFGDASRCEARGNL